MYNKSIMRRYAMSTLAAGLIFFAGISAAHGEDTLLYIEMNDVSGYLGEVLEIPIYVQTLADTLGGFVIQMVLDQRDLMYFEVDTTEIGEDTAYVCQFDTTGTLISGWQMVAARSWRGTGYNLRLVCFSDLGYTSERNSGIPDYTSGVIMRFYVRLRSDTPQDLTDRTAVVYIHEQASQYVTPMAHAIQPVHNGGLSITVEMGIPGDVNCDEAVNALDVTYMVNYVYRGMDVLCNYDLGDLNCDSLVNPIDLVLLINFVYKNWPIPPCP